MPGQNMFSGIDQWLIEKIYEAVGRPPIRLSLGNDTDVSPPDVLPVAEIIIQDRSTLLSLMLDPELAFGDAYSEGRISVKGNLTAALEAVYRSMSKVDHHTWYSRAVSRCMQFMQRNSLRGARKNIHQHYDLRTDFYQLWLDPQLVYTCAYFPSSSATLEEAQLAKLKYICRKLQLQPGDRVVDAGCGWGALALHMAQDHGVTVRAFNISHEQIQWARRRAKALGLTHRVEFIEDDYRNIKEKCDAFVSIGMLEHVGLEHYGGLGSVIHRSLAESGRGLLHFIGRNHPLPFSTWTRKRIFPGAYAPTLRQVTEIFEPWDLSVLDVENLRPHYARTLEHWLNRFERSIGQTSKMFGPEFVRAWRLYLAGAVAGFRTGTLQLFQIVFARTACQQIPSTRAHLYQGQPLEEREARWIHAMS
jgi:cyclopropane-fatty-acyl-phospholipid synthase